MWKAAPLAKSCFLRRRRERLERQTLRLLSPSLARKQRTLHCLGCLSATLSLSNVQAHIRQSASDLGLTKRARFRLRRLVHSISRPLEQQKSCASNRKTQRLNRSNFARLQSLELLSDRNGRRAQRALLHQTLQPQVLCSVLLQRKRASPLVRAGCKLQDSLDLVKRALSVHLLNHWRNLRNHSNLSVWNKDRKKRKS